MSPILVPKVGLERLPVTKLCPHTLGEDYEPWKR